MTTRAAFALTGLAIGIGTATPTLAYDSTLAIVRGLPNPTERIWRQGRSGFAIEGFDPVSYFSGAPEAGSPEHELVWQGVAWRFASAANRAAFRAAPESYAPQFGGYDAAMVAQGVPVEADPALWLVRGERLYLFRSEANRAAFLKAELDAAARKGWVQARGLLAGR